MKKAFIILLFIVTAKLIIEFPYTNNKEYIKTSSDDELMELIDNDCDTILATEKSFDQVHFFFYVKDGNKLTYVFVYNSDKGYDVSDTSFKSENYKVDNIRIKVIKEKNHPYIIIATNDISNEGEEPLTPEFISDNISSNFKYVNYTYMTVEKHYWITVVEELPDEYKIFVDQQELIVD